MKLKLPAVLRRVTYDEAVQRIARDNDKLVEHHRVEALRLRHQANQLMAHARAHEALVDAFAITAHCGRIE